MEVLLQVDDWVRATSASGYPAVPTGTIGIVLYVDYKDSIIPYAVQFDTSFQPGWCWVSAGAVERFEGAVTLLPLAYPELVLAKYDGARMEEETTHDDVE